MAPYQNYTLTDMLTQLSYKFEDVPFWVEAEAIDALNEALLMWNVLTGFWKETITLTGTATNWDYALPDSMVFGMRVLYNGKILSQASLSDMDNGKPGWQSQITTSGGNVPTSPQIWLPLSIDMIAIWPAPAVTGGIITVDGVMATPQLVAPGDFINIGNEELGAILGYALHALAFKEGGARFQSTMEYFKEFLQAAAEENDQLTESSEFRNFIGTDQNRQTTLTRGAPTKYDQLGGRKP